MEKGVRRTVAQGPGYVNPNLRFGIQARQKKARQSSYESKKKEWDDWEAQAEREEEAYRATRESNSRLRTGSLRDRRSDSQARPVSTSKYSERSIHFDAREGRGGRLGFESRGSRRRPLGSRQQTMQEAAETRPTSQENSVQRNFVRQRLMQKVMGFSRMVDDIQSSQQSRMAAEGIQDRGQRRTTSTRTVQRNVPAEDRADLIPSLDRQDGPEQGYEGLLETFGSDFCSTDSSSQMWDW